MSPLALLLMGILTTLFGIRMFLRAGMEVGFARELAALLAMLAGVCIVGAAAIQFGPP